MTHRLTRLSLFVAGLLTMVAGAEARAQPAPPAVGAPTPPSAQELAAIKIQQTGDWAKTAAAYEDLVKAEPDNPRAVFGLGASLHETGRPKEAIPVLQRAQTLGYQPVTQVRFRLARALARVGDKAAAIGELQQMATAGFTNLPLLQNADFDSVKDDPLFDAVAKKVTANASPCEGDPEFRRFDFWVGEWDVQQTGVPRAPVGAFSRVDKILNGCVILENWAPGRGGPQGKSFNTYNTVTKKWEQYWVDATGRITHYFGEFREGTLHYEADQFGAASKVRMTFFNQGPGEVRQLGHISTDGGKTWAVSFDLTYIRKK